MGLLLALVLEISCYTHPNICGTYTFAVARRELLTVSCIFKSLDSRLEVM